MSILSYVAWPATDPGVARAPDVARTDVAPAKMTAPPAAVAAARNAALRIAFGAVIGFLVAGAFQITLFFLPALLAAQLLFLMPRPPGLAQGAGLVFLMGVLAWITLLIAGAFSGQPVAYLMMIGLLLFFGFLLDSAGKAMPATLLLILGATLPLVVAQSDTGAAGIAGALVGAMAIALLAVWIAFALFPAAPAGGAAARAGRPASPRAALINTLLLVPVLLLFLIDGRMTFVAVIVIVNIIRQREGGAASLTALGLLFGNILGGVLASIAYVFVSLQTGPVFFLLVVLLVGLMLAGRGVVAGPRGPIYSVAFVSFIILLGLGASPVPSESAELFADRLMSVLAAGAYAVGAISLVSRRDPPRDRQARPEGAAKAPDGSSHLAAGLSRSFVVAPPDQHWSGSADLHRSAATPAAGGASRSGPAAGPTSLARDAPAPVATTRSRCARR